MNIIKFKDVTIEGNDFFNNYLSGKYALAVQYKYVYPLMTNGITLLEYIQLEKTLNGVDVLPVEETYMLYSEIESHIADTIWQDQNNEFDNLLMYNNIYDKEVSLEEANTYRKAVATFLHDGILPEKLSLSDNVMIDYYMMDMIDTTIINLLSMQQSYTNQQTSCGCGSSSSNTLLYTMQVAYGCISPIDSYKTSVRYHMTSLFGNIDFWKKCDVVLLENIIKYTQAVIDYNLPINRATQVIDINCNCASTELVSGQIYLQNILSNFIESLRLIINDDISDNKSTIANSLNAYALIYESLRW